MLFMILIHIFVLLPDQFKTYKLISVVFTVNGCCQDLCTLYPLLKEEAKIVTLLWCSKSLIKIEPDAIQIQMRDIILSFPCKLLFFFSIFLSGFCKPIYLHYFIQKGKMLKGQEVPSFVKKSVRLFIRWVRRRKRKGWFITKITREKTSMESSSTRIRFSMKSLLPCALPDTRLTDGSWIL